MLSRESLTNLCNTATHCTFIGGEREVKVLLHLGFHKTGTTTLQRTAQVNRVVLEEKLNFLLPDDLKSVAHLSRRFSLNPHRRTISKVRKRFIECIDSFDLDHGKPLLISCEELSGLIPGRKGVSSYEHAPALAQSYVSGLREVYGQCVDPTIWYTTRNSTDWVRSTYWQNLRGNRITEDLLDYEARLSHGANLAAVVQQTRLHLTGFARIKTTEVDTSPERTDLMKIALKILGVDAGPLKVTPNQNRQPIGGIEALLEINRSDLSDVGAANAWRRYLKEMRMQWNRAKGA